MGWQRYLEISSHFCYIPNSALLVLLAVVAKPLCLNIHHGLILKMYFVSSHKAEMPGI